MNTIDIALQNTTDIALQNTTDIALQNTIDIALQNTTDIALQNTTDTKTFSLADVPIYCLSYAGNDTRTKHIRDMEKEQNLSFKIIEGPASTDKLSKYESGALTFVHLILTHLKKVPFQPFVIIENDTSIYSRKYDTFAYPDDADAVFIGVSLWAMNLDSSEEYSLLNNSLKITQCVEYPHLYHDANMLSTHGVFVASHEYALHIADTCLHTVLTKQVPWDVPLAKDKLFYNVFALATPIFYQDSVVDGATYTDIDFVESTITKEEFDELKKNKLASHKFFKDY
jgi:hypothetical protein